MTLVQPYRRMDDLCVANRCSRIVEKFASIQGGKRNDACKYYVSVIYHTVATVEFLCTYFHDSKQSACSRGLTTACRASL
jgi:hypothetical protein